MAFVNEYVSEEDIKKYKLDQLWLGYSPAYKSVPADFRHKWTVDRERDAFFMVVGGGGREDFATIGLFYWKGNHYDIRYEPIPGGSESFAESPYRIIINLLEINRKKPKPEDAELIHLLKEGLTAYGYAGARRQVPNTVVEFTF